MPLRRSAATKVIVFQCPCGTRPIRRSPRRQRPLNRTIFVLAAVSSTNTKWAGSNMPCSRIQRRRARATSVRSCSAARRLFFESHLVALEEAPHRGATASNLVLAHRQDHLIQRQVRSFLDQTQQKIRMLLQRRGAPAPRLGSAAAVSRKHLTQMIAVLALTSNSSAASRRDAPLSTSAITRSRMSPEYAFGIVPPPKSESMPLESPIRRP